MQTTSTNANVLLWSANISYFSLSFFMFYHQTKESLRLDHVVFRETASEPAGCMERQVIMFDVFFLLIGVLKESNFEHT